MKLTKVIINNFRSFGDSQVIGFNDQTVLIGNNSSGKTTVLQALSKLFSDKQNDVASKMISGLWTVLKSPSSRAKPMASLDMV